MKNWFCNYERITDHGCSKERQVALECMGAALSAANTYEGTYKVVSCDEKNIYVDDKTIPFESIGRIFVVGAGKGSFPIVKALQEILRNRIYGGAVALKDESEILGDSRIEIIHSSHPVPDEKSLLAGQKIAEIASQVTENDLVFVCVTGGCSSLMVLPPEPLSIQDISALGKELMKCGAAISDINTVRKHTCRLKGGGLLNMLRKARVITLTQDTRPENLPWPDPVLPDPTTFQDALDVLKKYDMYKSVPPAVVEYIEDGLNHPERESLKTEEGISHQLYDVGNQRSACEAAKKKAEELGYHGYILSTKIEGEAREVGSAFAGIAKEVSLYNRPFVRPCVIISAGETTVTVDCDNPGKGGPNQEFVLGFAEKISNYDNVVCLSIDSEGTDGPTSISGGIVDSSTSKKAEELNVDIFKELRVHNSSYVLEKTGDYVFTGPTGTNVVNLRALVIGE